MKIFKIIFNILRILILYHVKNNNNNAKRLLKFFLKMSHYFNFYYLFENQDEG